MQQAAAFAATLASRQTSPSCGAPSVLPPPSVGPRADGVADIPDGEAGPRPREVPRGLTPRLATVSELVAQGYGNKEIGRQLGLTEATVKVHVKTALRHAGMSNRTQLAIWWVQGGRDAAPVPALSRNLPPLDWTNPENVSLLRRLIEGGFDHNIIRNAFGGAASEDVLTVALALLGKSDHPTSP